MQNELNIAMIQSDLVWEKPDLNRNNFANKINQISVPIDVIVLPEMFTTGFTMNASEVAETMEGETLTWMKDLASKHDVLLIGSVIISENESYYNRLLAVFPNGDFQQYDKRHTFTLAGEHEVYTAGTKKLIIEYKGWRMCPLICYDLRFPVWARNVEQYDILFFVANWPKVRIDAWDTLLKARAIENMSYCVGVNRVGLDGNQYEYSGHSAAYDILGKKLDEIPIGREAIGIITLNKSHIETFRNKLNFLNDKDTFNLLVE